MGASWTALGSAVGGRGGTWCKRLEPRADKILLPETRACILGCGEQCGYFVGDCPREMRWHHDLTQRQQSVGPSSLG